MGGRGTESGGRMSGGGGLPVSAILDTRSLLSERESKTELVDEVLTTLKDLNDVYDNQVGDIVVAKLDTRHQHVMGFCDGDIVGINESFFDAKRADSAYDRCVEKKFHPGRGDKTALQAVTAHEVGHQLTQVVANKLGTNLDSAADRIVNDARKQTRHRGNVKMARKISGYATASNAEAVAEAISDVYCNGARAKAESLAIVNAMKKYM